MRTSLKYYPRLKVWKNTTGSVTFDPETFEAHSYTWWKFVCKIGDYIVLNTYSYSVSTSAHQAEVFSLLENKYNINCYYYCEDEPKNPNVIQIEAPDGLGKLHAAIRHYTGMIKELLKAINTPRSHKKKNEERRALIEEYKKKISIIECLIELQKTN